MLHWQGYLYFLFGGLKKIPDEQVTIYRGMPFLENIKNSYTFGRHIHWSGFSSGTTLLETALSFACKEQKKGIIFEISVRTAKNLQAYSFFPMEREFLLHPNSAFQVTKAAHKKNPQKWTQKLNLLNWLNVYKGKLLFINWNQ